MEAKLSALVAAKVTLVISLMESDESDHSGSPFIDYARRLEEIAFALKRSIRRVRFEIPDRSIPSPGVMRAILDAIKAEMANEGTVYVHCWGGKGRTGTVVGCLLLELGDENAETILPRLKTLTAHASGAFWPTPQTPEQCAFVLNWKHG
jgi:protein tyrosine phosphatase